MYQDLYEASAEGEPKPITESIKETLYTLVMITALLGSPIAYQCINPPERKPYNPEPVKRRLLGELDESVGAELGPMYMTQNVDGELRYWAESIEELDNWEKEREERNTKPNLENKLGEKEE
jgi:hypothetical protein